MFRAEKEAKNPNRNQIPTQLDSTGIKTCGLGSLNQAVPSQQNLAIAARTAASGLSLALLQKHRPVTTTIAHYVPPDVMLLRPKSTTQISAEDCFRYA